MKARTIIELLVAVPFTTLIDLINAGEWLNIRSDFSSEYMIANIGVRVESEPIYVSRPSERVVVGDSVIFLPREYDHLPDGWTPPMYEALWDGVGITPHALQTLLEVAEPVKPTTAEQWATFKDKVKEKLP